MAELTVELLKAEAKAFADIASEHDEPDLYTVTDGKSVGTHFEHKFHAHLSSRYDYLEGSSAIGIDFPELGVDMKVTSAKRPQSSCPYKSARQKIYGLGYSLLIFVYEKQDNEATSTGRLDIQHVIFVEAGRTADFQMTMGISEIVEKQGNKDDLIAFMMDRMLPVDDIQASNVADEILREPPDIGYLTISNALQWRLQFSRAIDQADLIAGVVRLK